MSYGMQLHLSNGAISLVTFSSEEDVANFVNSEIPQANARRELVSLNHLQLERGPQFINPEHLVAIEVI